MEEIEIPKEISDHMYQFINEIIDKCGPRMPCSIQEAKAAEIIKNELKNNCDKVEIEEFNCNPRAFLGFIRIDVILVLCAFVLMLLFNLEFPLFIYQILSGMAFFLNLIAFIILWNEFFNYREFIDPLFKKKTSQNVIGTINSIEEKQKIIIFSAHHDSALQFNLLTYLKIGYPIIIFLGLLIMFIWLIFTGIILIFLLGFSMIIVNNNAMQLFILILFLIAIPIFIALFFFVPFGEKANKVPGAVDNLSSVGIIVGLGRFLKTKNDFIPKNVEIKLISFGCEEAGLRGAYRYVDRHLEELKKYDAECVNMDTIQSVKNVSIIDNEPSTRTRHSIQVVEKLRNAAKKIHLDLFQESLGGSSKLSKILGQIAGGTDATAFSKANVKAASIVAMDLKKMLDFYHQPSDTIDKIERGALEKVLKLCLSYLKVSN